MARGVPKERGRLVTRMKIGQRWEGWCSFAASEAEVEDAGYSPFVLLVNLVHQILVKVGERNEGEKG